MNGALEYLAKDLGIAENTVAQGKFISFSTGLRIFHPFCVLFPMVPLSFLMHLTAVMDHCAPPIKEELLSCDQLRILVSLSLEVTTNMKAMVMSIESSMNYCC